MRELWEKYRVVFVIAGLLLYIIISLIRYLAFDINGTSTWVGKTFSIIQKTFSYEQKTKIVSSTSSLSEVSGAAISTSVAHESLSNKIVPNQKVQNNIRGVRINEVMVGKENNASHEFIELFNSTDHVINLSGAFIQKINSNGKSSTLVASDRFAGTSIQPNSYFLLANQGGYSGAPVPDVWWAKSNTLAYASNSVRLFDENRDVIDTVRWEVIPRGESFARNDAGLFVISSSTPHSAQN